MSAYRVASALLLLPLSIFAVGSCGGRDLVSPGSPRLVLSPSQVELGAGRTATLTLSNTGRGDAGGISIEAAPVTIGPAQAQGIRADVEPALVNELEAGASVTLTLTLEVETGVREGTYSTAVRVRRAGVEVASSPVTLRVDQLRAMAFSPDELDIGTAGSFEAWLRNVGTVPLESVNFVAGAVRPVDESDPGSARATVSTEPTSTLEPGDSVLVEGTVTPAEMGREPGAFRFRLTAVSASGISQQMDIRFRVPPPESVEVTAPGSVEVGEAFPFDVVVRDSAGQVTDGYRVTVDDVGAESGIVDGVSEVAVGYATGELEITARVGDVTGSAAVTLVPREKPPGELSVLGSVELCVNRRFEALALRGPRTYLASWGFAGPLLVTMDVSASSSPAVVDSLPLVADDVTDIALRGDGRLAVVNLDRGEEQGGPALGLLDLSDPDAPRLVGEATESLDADVLGLTVEGDVVYAARRDGLSIFEVSDPAQPRLLFAEAPSSRSQARVEVAGGRAIVQGTRGITIYGVGSDGAAGSPEAPVSLTEISAPAGVFFSGAPPLYDPERERLYVSIFDTRDGEGLEGIWVYDLADLADPRLLATAIDSYGGAPSVSPAAMDLDPEEGLLYVSWETRGVVVLDVGGDLLGDMLLGDREVTEFQYLGPSEGCNGSGPFASDLVLDGDRVLLTDRGDGLIVLRGF